MRPPVNPKRPTIRQFAVQLGRSPAEFVARFEQSLPCDADGRVVIPEAIKALELWGYPAKRWIAETAERNR